MDHFQPAPPRLLCLLRIPSLREKWLQRLEPRVLAQAMGRVQRLPHALGMRTFPVPTEKWIPGRDGKRHSLPESQVENQGTFFSKG